MADLVQVTNQLKTLNEKTEKLTTIISATNTSTQEAQVEVQTNTEVVKNDDAVIDGQDETNNKLGFLGKTFQKISTFFAWKTREKRIRPKTRKYF